jgi:hypothetical protein
MSPESLTLPETDEELADVIETPKEECSAELPEHDPTAGVRISLEGKSRNQQQHYDARKKMRGLTV